jgi:acyl-[acyl-carrier-protein]-phospholipid O-acyltransferase/long-chain-fatty-acid--[acyl-carrier-protein] ligase
MIAFLRFLLRLLYRFRIHNGEVLNTPGPVLLLPNHSSWWDWLMVGVCLESDWKFVVSAESAKTSWFHKKVMINRRTFPVDINSAYAVKHMAEHLQKGGRLVLFPEGRLSRTGSLMKLFDGTGFLIFKTHAKVITGYIRGAYRLPWSPNPAEKRWFPNVSIHFSDALTPPYAGHSSVSEARHRLTDWLEDRMVRQQFETEMQFGPRTLSAAVTEAACDQPGKTIVQDSTMKRLSYRTLLIGAGLLANQWRQMVATDEQRVGVLLPNTNAMPAALLSLWFAGKVPAVLNYSTGISILLACSKLGGLKHIITSRDFLSHLKLDVQALESAGIHLLYLEDIRKGISRSDRNWAFIRSLFGLEQDSHSWQAQDTAVVLFTSGSEGDPKGVELTHRNVLANIRQMLAVIDLWETDRFFNALPLFHSFGLTVGLLLPLIRCVYVFLYPSPLHYRVVPSAFYNLDCTVLFGTNTFLSGYARKANPYDFRTLRYLFAGAEKLQEATANLWARKFGVRILEGYGATECSPCVSANTPLRHKHGTAGRLLPDIEYRLESVAGLEPVGQESPLLSHRKEETERHAKASDNSEPVGRLFVKGPNVMKGYLNPAANEKFKTLAGWYDTGDIAKVDKEGFLHIVGRLKRFAKISGEMVSLTAIEESLAGAFPQYGLRFAAAVVAKPDEQKGEKLIVVSNEPKLSLEQVRDAIRSRGLSNLAVPREIKHIHDLPKLGTGKINHREIEKMV